jgi:hypothetical protein
MYGSYFTKLGLLTIIVVGPTCANCSADESTEPDKTRIVLRISREFIRQHTQPAIDESSPIDKFLFGANVTGWSRTTGTTRVEMDMNDEDAYFIFHFDGVTINQSVARHKPVAVYSTSRVEFQSQRRIRFDGLRFLVEPVTIQATSSSTIDGVETPGGLRGRIAQRRAWQQIEQNKPEGDAISLADTRALVLTSFNRESDRVVKGLNGVVPWEQTIALFTPGGAKDWVTRLKTTKEYLLASPGPKDSDIPELPKAFLQMQAPIELWLRGNPAGEPARRLLEKWNMAKGGFNRLTALVSSEPAKVDGVKFSAVGDWWVLTVGEDSAVKLLGKVEEKNKKSSAAK